ncbi:hypothetical protein [Sorangium sp. So ce385]|uniref:hypothetical protein n=1 Tax=Sorangium sp. So ce385 TaxID=3133308 RepID=UPI003F5C2241
MTTTYDYWHIHRYLQLQGSNDDDVLPFEAGPMVMGNVVSMREPVWRAAVATARQLGVPDVFASWRRGEPLPPSVAASALPSLTAAVEKLGERGDVFFPPDLAEDMLPSAAAVHTALRALCELFKLAIEQKRAVETWAD